MWTTEPALRKRNLKVFWRRSFSKRVKKVKDNSRNFPLTLEVLHSVGYFHLVTAKSQKALRKWESMNKRLLSIVLSLGLITGVGVASATSAIAATKPAPAVVAAKVAPATNTNVVVKVVAKVANQVLSFITDKGTNPSPGAPSIAKSALNVVQQSGGVINAVMNTVKFAAVGAVAVGAAIACFLGDGC